MKLTNASIARLPDPVGRQTFVNDDAVSGLAVRLSPGGTKAFVWQYRDPVTGRKKRKTIGRTNVIGVDAARKTVMALQQQLITDPKRFSKETAPRFTLEDAFNLYLKTGSQAESTRDLFHSLWRTNVTANLKTTPLADVTRRDLVKVADTLVLADKPGAAVATHKMLKAMMNAMLRKGHLESNPLAGIPAPATLRPRERVLSSSELVSVWNAAESLQTRFTLAIQTLILTGCRKGEVFGLRHAELENGTITLPGTRTKNRHVLMLTLPSRLTSSLDSVLASPKCATYVFGVDTVPPNAEHVKEQIDKRCGFSDWTIHDLRRTAATNMAMLGIAPHVIEAVLNHKSGTVSGVAAVYNRYSYAREKAEALQQYEDWVSALTA